MAALRKTFSRPVNSGWKPAPISISEPTRPPTASTPVVGAKIPAMSLSSVDLPDPFRPTIPNASPGRTCRSTSCKAQSSRVRGSSRRRIVSFNERLVLSVILNRRPTPRPTTSPGATSTADSELNGKAILVPLDDPEPEQGQGGPDHEDVDEQRRAGNRRLEERRAEALDIGRDGVPVTHYVDQPPVARRGGQLLEPVEDRCEEEPRQEQHGEQVLHVAEEDVHDRQQPREAKREADERPDDSERRALVPLPDLTAKERPQQLAIAGQPVEPRERCRAGDVDCHTGRILSAFEGHLRVVIDVSPLSVPRTGIGNYVRGLLAGLLEVGGDRHEVVAFGLSGPSGCRRIREALDGLPAELRLPLLPRAKWWRSGWSRLGRPPGESVVGPLDAVHFSDWLYPSPTPGAPCASLHDLAPL